MRFLFLRSGYPFIKTHVKMYKWIGSKIGSSRDKKYVKHLWVWFIKFKNVDGISLTFSRNLINNLQNYSRERSSSK